MGFVAVLGAGIQLLLAHGASATVPAMTGHLPFLFTIHGGPGGMAVLKDRTWGARESGARVLSSHVCLGGSGNE